MKFFKRLTQRGDTILEVLIAIGVLSLVLTLSLALTNRSTQGNRQAQERGEASKHAQTQIEQLKTYISQTATPALPANGSKFCMKGDGTPTVAISGSIPATLALQQSQDPDFNTFKDPALAECNKGEFFHTYIERNGNTFTAHTRWLKVAGRGIDETTMIHRIYPDLASGNTGGSTATPGCSVNEGMNSAGGCTPCPNGYSSPGGTTPLQNCQLVKPKIIAHITRVRPINGNTPPCTSTVVDAKSGISATLTKSGFSATQVTDSFSNATFQGLDLLTTYTAAVTAPARYNVCPPSSQLVTSTGQGTQPGVGTEKTIEFKIQPICVDVPIWGVVDQGSWHDHWKVQDTWFEHTGPDWGPWGPPSTNLRYAIGSGKSYPNEYYEGAWPFRTLYVLDHYDTQGQGGWYNRYTEFQWWVFDFWHWHSNLVPAIIGYTPDCPS